MADAWDKVRSLYRDYGDTVSLLVIDVELKYREFPTIVLNEIRAFTAHVSRLANDVHSEEEAEEQVRRAARHITRIKLDLHKILCLWFADEYLDRFPKKYKHVPLDGIIIEDNPFQLTFNKLVADGMKLVQEAKQTEVAHPAEASLPIYEDALAVFRQLESLIKKNQHHLDECKRRYKRERWMEWAVAFVLGIAASALVQFASGLLSN